MERLLRRNPAVYSAIIFAIALSSCRTKINDAETQAVEAAVSTVTQLTFSGIGSITDVTGTSAKLNWAHVPGAALYLVYNVTSGAPVLVSSVNAPVAVYAVSGLTVGTTYKYRVRVIDEEGNRDSNINDVSFTTSSLQAAHGGWKHIEASGGSVPHVVSSDLPTTGASVKLLWNEMPLTEGSIASYSIYRATASGAQNFLAPLASGLSAATRSFTDSTVAADTIYYYVIRPVHAGSGTELPVSGAMAEIKIPVPPVNMSLVHPYAANREMCLLMGKTPDPLNGNRCPYNGPKNVGGYYDFQKSLLVDTYELGCNFTPAPACGGGGCFGNAAPSNAIGVDGDVYWNREFWGGCRVKVAGAWVTAADLAAGSAELSVAFSNKRGLPPVTINHDVRMDNICTAASAGSYGSSKRLPRHSEQVVYNAWPEELTVAQITAYEQLMNNVTIGNGCNTHDSANGLTYEDSLTPANMDTLPYRLGGAPLVRTGSLATANCTTRYGLRDALGNVSEVASDTVDNCSSVTNTCTGRASFVDPVNDDFLGYDLSGSVGPGGQLIGNRRIKDDPVLGMHFQAVLGLPLVASAPASFEGLAIGIATGQFHPDLLRGSHFLLDFTHGARRTVKAGGNTAHHVPASRFTINFDDGAFPGLGGGRCVVSVN